MRTAGNIDFVYCECKSGQIKEPEESTKWVPAYELVERVKKQEVEQKGTACKLFSFLSCMYIVCY